MVNFDLKISNLTFPKGVFVATMIIALLIAPLFYIYEFDNKLFFSTDLIKLLLIAVMRAVIVLAINLVLTSMAFENSNKIRDEKRKEQRLISMYTTASIFSAGVFYAPFILKDMLEFLNASPFQLALIAQLTIASIPIRETAAKEWSKRRANKKTVVDTPALESEIV